LRKLKWMMIMALSPEIVISVCMADLLWARDSVAKFAKLKSKSESTDTLKRTDTEKDVEKLEVTVSEKELSNQEPLYVPLHLTCYTRLT